jgi:hypothetical protein
VFRCSRGWRSRQPTSPHLIVLLPVLPVWLLANCPAVSVICCDPPLALNMRPLGASPYNVRRYAAMRGRSARQRHHPPPI